MAVGRRSYFPGLLCQRPFPLQLPGFFFSSRRRHTRWTGDWSSDVCSSDLRHPRRADAVFELIDQVLLLAPVICQEDDLLGRRGLIVRQIEEISNLIEEPVVALLHR